MSFPPQSRAIREGAGEEHPENINRSGLTRAGTPQGGVWGRWGEWASPGPETRSRRDKQEALRAVPAGPGLEWAVGGAQGSHAPSSCPDPSYHCSGGHPASTPAHSYRLTRPPSGRRSQRPGATWRLRGGEQGGRGLRSCGGGVKGWLEPPSLAVPPPHLCACTFQSKISPSLRALGLESAPPSQIPSSVGSPVRRLEGQGGVHSVHPCPPASWGPQYPLPPLSDPLLPSQGRPGHLASSSLSFSVLHPPLLCRSVLL